MNNIILLDFGDFQLDAELFETEIAKKFYNNLPYEIKLTQWGREMYGTIGLDLGTDTPIPDIPTGGLAYTNQGNYFLYFLWSKTCLARRIYWDHDR